MVNLKDKSSTENSKQDVFSESIETKVPRHRKEHIERDAKFQGISVSDWCRNAFSHYLECRKTLHSFHHATLTEKIDVPIPWNCSRCGKHMPEFTEGRYYRVSGDVVCPECYAKRRGENAIVAETLEEADLKERIKTLQEHLHRLALEGLDQNNKLRQREVLKKHEKNQDMVMAILKLYSEFMRQFGAEAKEPLLESLREGIPRMMEQTKRQIDETEESTVAYEISTRRQIQRLKKRKPSELIESEQQTQEQSD